MEGARPAAEEEVVKGRRAANAGEARSTREGNMMMMDDAMQ
jgi:hypothetical protein